MESRFIAGIITLVMILSVSSVWAEDNGLLLNNTSMNASITITPEQNLTPTQGELLMNLAQEARSYALENGRVAALSAFSDKATFVRGDMYITAYDPKGTLLADPFNQASIGSSCIGDDHDTGIVRQLRDLAQSGGGIMTPEMSGVAGKTYYVHDIDGSWWMAAVLGKA
ncbi:MAG TPA: hypothetical protein VN372_06060 [Methanospirillum sp.]|nr:hypothetical protein [Methanospirillum sp.]